jgi:hypothetical protein
MIKYSNGIELTNGEKILLIADYLIIVMIFLGWYFWHGQSSSLVMDQYTRILCGNGYCVDVIVYCSDGKVRNVVIISEPVKMNYTDSVLGWCDG